MLLSCEIQRSKQLWDQSSNIFRWTFLHIKVIRSIKLFRLLVLPPPAKASSTRNIYASICKGKHYKSYLQIFGEDYKLLGLAITIQNATTEACHYNKNIKSPLISSATFSIKVVHLAMAQRSIVENHTQQITSIQTINIKWIKTDKHHLG